MKKKYRSKSYARAIVFSRRIENSGRTNKIRGISNTTRMSFYYNGIDSK